MVEEMESRLKRCPCCGGETVLGSLYGCRPWVTYWLPRYRTPPAPNQSYYCPNCKLLLTRVDGFRTP